MNEPKQLVPWHSAKPEAVIAQMQEHLATARQHGQKLGFVVAMVLQKKDGDFYYDLAVSPMPAECAILGVELLKQRILEFKRDV